MGKVNIKVYGMHCKSCELLLEERLSQLKDIKHVKADFKKNELQIETQNHNPGIADIEKL